MTRKCALCNEEVEEDYGKLKGAVIKVKVKNKNIPIFVCSYCQKQDNWIEKAKIKAA